MTPKFADRGKRRLHLIGAVACLLAIFLSAGGHWALLQSFAYTRMLLEFSQQDSWCAAMQKTFDERYACPLCPKIRDGYNKQHNTPMSLEGVHQPEFLVQSKGLIFFTPDLGTEIAFVLPGHIDFLKAPPKPPPRVA